MQRLAIQYYNRVTPCHAIKFRASQRHATPWHAMPSHTTQCHVMPRGPTEDIIHYFTLMSSELHYLDIIPKIENLH